MWLACEAVWLLGRRMGRPTKTAKVSGMRRVVESNVQEQHSTGPGDGARKPGLLPKPPGKLRQSWHKRMKSL